MGKRARVTSIDALRRFQPALTKFVEETRAALIAANSDAGRTLTWLKREQLGHWKREVRRRRDDVTRAKSEVMRKEMGPAGEGVSALEISQSNHEVLAE